MNRLCRVSWGGGQLWAPPHGTLLPPVNLLVGHLPERLPWGMWGMICQWRHVPHICIYILPALFFTGRLCEAAARQADGAEPEARRLTRGVALPPPILQGAHLSGCCCWQVCAWSAVDSCPARWRSGAPSTPHSRCAARWLFCVFWRLWRCQRAGGVPEDGCVGRLRLPHKSTPAPQINQQVVILYVDEEESVRRQMRRAQLAAMHNKRVMDAGARIGCRWWWIVPGLWPWRVYAAAAAVARPRPTLPCRLQHEELVAAL